jgi:hypothetical protein
MTDDEARKLAQRITDTWPTGARAYIWRDILRPLDPHLALTVYRTIRDNNTHPPTPGEYKLAYKQALARTIALEQPELPLSNVIGLDQYLQRVTDQDELQHWHRLQRS